jgi:XTP/dITP diphosphohydrolase
MKFATSNFNKIREAREILNINIEQIGLELDEIQAIDPSDIIENKARSAFMMAGEPIIVEDTGLKLNSWNGLPGALVKWFIETVGREGIIKMLAPFTDRSATAVTAVGFWDGERLVVGKGECPGRIAVKPLGESGFGWDPIFIPDGHELTFAQMGPDEKNKISMRKLAFEELRKKMKLSS